MNRIAFISDTHGDFKKTEKVVLDIKKRGIKEIYSAGDIAGYGSEVYEIIDFLEKENIKTVLGNNDGPYMHMDYIKNAKFSESIDFCGKKILLVHGSPNSLSEYIFEDDEFRQRSIAKTLEEDVLIFGHTHMFYKKEVLGKLFVNAGSVSRPKDGNPKGGYVILTIGDEIDVEFVRI